MKVSSVRYAIAIFTARESAEHALRAVGAVCDADSSGEAVVDLLVNGNRGLAEKLQSRLPAWSRARDACNLRLWYHAMPDKPNTWNQYIHQIWQDSQTVFFVDGYALVQKGALVALDRALERNPAALGATAVPTAGPSAEKLRSEMLRIGGMHGTLFAIRGTVLRELAARGFKLPIGLYRNDALLGAVLCFGLDPAKFGWAPERICVVPEASWDVAPSHLSLLANLRTHVKRRLRQIQGAFENLAVKDHLAVKRLPIGALPETAVELVMQWVNKNPWAAAAEVSRNPAALYVLHKLRSHRRSSSDIAPPQLLWQSASVSSYALATSGEVG